MSAIEFEIEHVDATSRGRAGRLTTPHGTVQTPAFMPVGTAATVKGIAPKQLEEIGVEIVLANTYHLALRPGADAIAELGGLHRFMGWNGPLLTDSGGFQVFSLANLTRLDDEQVVFKSHLDGSPFELSPEKAIRIQEQLGADVILCLDECPPHGVPHEKVVEAVDRTTRWARRCTEAIRRSDQALFGIVQGGTDPALRERSAAGLVPLGFCGYAIGGLGVGESPEEMYETLDAVVPMLPAEWPHYLMGVGRPIDLVEAVFRGVDLFDCVMPTRNGRNATAFTSTGILRLRNAGHARDPRPLDEQCACPVCRQFSRAYLRHLFMADEMLGPVLLSLHNVAYYEALMAQLRSACLEDRLGELRALQLAHWGTSV
jgi:queuine tRNA-ribosyltransferase